MMLLLLVSSLLAKTGSGSARHEQRVTHLEMAVVDLWGARSTEIMSIMQCVNSEHPSYMYVLFARKGRGSQLPARPAER
jgi:hypothetical protein